MNKPYTHGSFLYGVVYYPEQWPEKKWDSDLERIAQTGMNVVRMGEGAWSFWEPEEGRYEFELFDRALALCAQYELKAIMGTPTYTPPAWLSESYPEVLRVTFQGQKLFHGSRRHYNYTSAIYQEKSEEIVTALAEHYADHPVVIGWQIDNEFNCHLDVSFAESDHLAFRNWCQERYTTLAALNEAWGTAFWSQTYSSWQQVWLPRPTTTYQNPALLLDFYRFTSDATIEFGARQKRLIRSIAPRQFITHNAFQSMTNVDLPRFMNQVVDFLSYDSYPEFKVANPQLPMQFRDRAEGRQLARIRGVSKKFIVLEQQSGPSGQIGGILNGNPDYLHPTPQPGQMRLWVWNSIAHGADGVLYFRWRSLPYGAEAHWNGLLYHDERNAWRLNEAKQIGDELERLASTLLETDPVPHAAILYDFDNYSHAQIEHFTGQHRDSSEQSVYRALSERHLLTDLRPLSNDADELMTYQIIFFPHAHVLEATEIESLRSYVENGGTLVFGCWSAYRNRMHQCYDADGRAFYEQLTGMRVVDFTTVPATEKSEIEFKDSGAVTEAPIFNEVLAPEGNDATPLANYRSNYYAGKPAVILNRIGKGRVIHFGAFFTHGNTLNLLDALNIQDPLRVWLNIPAGIEAIVRSRGSENFCFLLNFTATPQDLEFNQPGYDLLGDKKMTGCYSLAPYEVLFVRFE